MTEIISGSFGEPENPAQQAEALKRLQFVMSQLPDMAVPLNPPAEYDPVVINVKQMQAVSLWNQLRWQIDLIKAELDLCAISHTPAPGSLQNQVTKLINDIASLQKDLQCAFPSQPTPQSLS